MCKLIKAMGKLTSPAWRRLPACWPSSLTSCRYETGKNRKTAEKDDKDTWLSVVCCLLSVLLVLTAIFCGYAFQQRI